MEIIATKTESFELYDVFLLPDCKCNKWMKKLGLCDCKPVKLDNVLQANDGTGLVIQRVLNENGEELYSNGADDIAIDNVVKLLLLVPQIQQQFFAAGFTIKTSQTFQKIKIVKSVTEEIVL